MQFKNVQIVDDDINERETREARMHLVIDSDRIRHVRLRADVVSCAINVAAVAMGILIGWLLRGGR